MEKKKPFIKADDLLKALVINKDHVTQYATGLFSPHDAVDRPYLADLFRELENLGLVKVIFAGNNVVYHVRITPDGYEYEKHIDRTRWRNAKSMFEPLLDPYRTGFLEIIQQYPEGSIIPYGTETDSLIKALKMRGYLRDFEAYLREWGVYYTYDDIHYLELEENYKQVRDQANLNIKFEGGNNQLNLAKDNATIHATQNFGFDTNKLAELIKDLQEQSKDLSPKDKQSVDESLDTIQDQLTSQKPKKSLINFATKVLQAIGGSVEFLAAAATLVQFVQTVISTIG